MTFKEMCMYYTTKTGRLAWIPHDHPAGPSICTRGSDGHIHGVVIPIDDESRINAINLLISNAGA
jgi:hypothetical protein